MRHSSSKTEPREQLRARARPGALPGPGTAQDRAAIEAYRCALARQPHSVALWLDMGNACARAGNLLEAIACYGNGLRLDPDSGPTWNNFGNLFLRLDDIDSAISCYRHASRLLPSDALSAYGLGRALNLVGNHREARDHLALACALDSAHADAWINLGNAHQHLGDPVEALRCFDRALALSPHPAEAQMNRAMVLLDQENFAEGWPAYEHRWDLPSFASVRQRFLHRPQWQGESLDGRRILLYGEQGFGDMVQFARFIPQIAALGAEVFLEVPQRLTELLSGLPGLHHTLARGDALPDFDFHCPLMSIPLALGLDVASIPSQRYLSIPEPVSKAAHRALRALTHNAPAVLHAGISWRGNPSHPWDRVRSLRLSHFAPLAAVAGVQWHVLQKDATKEEMAAWPGPPALRHACQLDGFLTTAALIQQLDLVVSVDTVTAHLTGALGKPLWLLLPAFYDWRWHSQRSDSPWYPSARLYRQTEPGNWTGVVERIRDDLAELVSAKSL